jgi:mRNA interferase MazF
MSKHGPKRGDIYWANLDPVEGSEQGKSRPVFIISNNLMNVSAPIVQIIPMTKSKKEAKSYPFNIEFQYCNLQIDDNIVEDLRKEGHFYVQEDGFFLCNQARAISKERLIAKLGTAKSRELYINEIENAIVHSFALDACQSCYTPLRHNSTHCPNPKCKKRAKKKCSACNIAYKLSYKYCPECGKEI